MIERINFDQFGFKDVEEIEKALKVSNGMMHRNDYQALSAITKHTEPKRIFEIGTYEGVTSNFLLNILPEAEVISISLVDGEDSNNKISKGRIGSKVESKNLDRFIQIYGNSHDLDPLEFVSEFGFVDMVFIDGDHTYEGVKKDTFFARAILNPKGGVIAWHDANPKNEYMSVKGFLEEYSEHFRITATLDNYIGGVAYTYV